MGTECYGGSCPKCQKNLLMKHETGTGWFQFDACVWCGFANGEANNQDLSQEQVWRNILEHYQATDKKQLIREFDLDAPVSEPDSLIWPSVFVYSEHDAAGITNTPYNPRADFMTVFVSTDPSVTSRTAHAFETEND